VAAPAPPRVLLLLLLITLPPPQSKQFEQEQESASERSQLWAPTSLETGKFCPLFASTTRLGLS